MTASKRRKMRRMETPVEVDHAAVADSFADADGRGSDSDENSENELEKHGAGGADETPDDSSAASDRSSAHESDADEDSSVDEDPDLESESAPSNQQAPPTSASGEQCTFDLRNLLAINSHQVRISSLYSSKKRSKSNNEELLTIPPDRLDVVVSEDYLLEKATDGCTQLIASLWQLPVTRTDAGPMVDLPSYDESRIPRALPPPPPKQETAWEKFAKQRGIPLNKNKRSQKVWDEATGTWMFRHGYKKANDNSKEWPIMEVKANEDPFEDPWERQREAKRARTEQNSGNRLRNLERSGQVAKGSANKILRNREKVRQAGKAGGNLDRDATMGIPVDLKASRDGVAAHPLKRGKASTMAALAATQRSTASLGKFDKMREGEPERKKMASRPKKRFESSTDKKVTSTESDRNLKILKAVVDGGGVAKERAIKKGKLAKGETAYDYDFDDGLGPSTFRKKKGRAGAGRAKKMTKKRSR